MLQAFEARVKSLPHDVAFMLGEGWVHRPSKQGVTTVLVFPPDRSQPRIVEVDQGEEEEPTESVELRGAIMAALEGCLDPDAFPALSFLLSSGHPPLSNYLLVTRDVMLPFDVETARRGFGFAPHASVLFLGDRNAM